MPDGWAVARMGTYITFTGGAQPPKETFEYSPNENNIRLIQIRDYKTDDFATYIPKKLARRFCSKTDVMIGRYGPPLFQILRGIEGAYNVAIMKAEAVPEIMQNDYLYYMLQDGTLLHFLESLSDRTCGQDGVNMFELNNYLILIPPYEEQTRIIKKLEETFPIIESLAENIDDLKVAIKHAKSKILDLAIHGKLVPQDPNDEPAEELLKSIATSDNRPYKKFDDDIPFSLPQNWEWCYLGDICKVSSAKRVLQQDWKDSGIPFYRAREIAQLSNNETVKEDLFITPELYDELKNKYGVPVTGDLMISAVGTIGKVYIVKESDCFYYKDASVICFSKKEKSIDSKYLKLCLESGFLQNQIYSQSTGTTVDTITINKAQEYLFPLPNIKEQKRIVSKIEELFSYLDTISSNLE